MFYTLAQSSQSRNFLNGCHVRAAHNVTDLEVDIECNLSLTSILKRSFASVEMTFEGWRRVTRFRTLKRKLNFHTFSQNYTVSLSVSFGAQIINLCCPLHAQPIRCPITRCFCSVPYKYLLAMLTQQTLALVAFGKIVATPKIPPIKTFECSSISYMLSCLRRSEIVFTHLGPSLRGLSPPYATSNEHSLSRISMPRMMYLVYVVTYY